MEQLKILRAFELRQRVSKRLYTKSKSKKRILTIRFFFEELLKRVKYYQETFYSEIDRQRCFRLKAYQKKVLLKEKKMLFKKKRKQNYRRKYRFLTQENIQKYLIKKKKSLNLE